MAKKRDNWTVEIVDLKEAMKRYNKVYKRNPELLILHRCNRKTKFTGLCDGKELRQLHKDGDLPASIWRAYEKIKR